MERAVTLDRDFVSNRTQRLREIPYSAEETNRPRSSWEEYFEERARIIFDRAKHVSLKEGVSLRYNYRGAYGGDLFVTYRFHDAETNEVLSTEENDYHRFLEYDKSPEGTFEYWLIVKELSGASSWGVTELVLTEEDYERLFDEHHLRIIAEYGFTPARCQPSNDEPGELQLMEFSPVGKKTLRVCNYLIEPNGKIRNRAPKTTAVGEGGIIF